MTIEPARPAPEPVRSAPPDARSEPPTSPPAEPPTPALLQILSTEHYSLLASRQLAWTESFTRGTMFLSTLSFATVALALVAQATAFGEGFRLFALVVLPVVLFLGIGTMLRLDNAGYHDLTCIVGMNRIRAGYLEMAPEFERFRVMGMNDDIPGIEVTMSNVPGRSYSLSIVAAIPFQIAVLNCVLAGVVAALLAVQLGATMTVALVAGAAGFGIGLVAFAVYANRVLGQITRDYRPRFPTPEDATSRL